MTRKVHPARTGSFDRHFMKRITALERAQAAGRATDTVVDDLDEVAPIHSTGGGRVVINSAGAEIGGKVYQLAVLDDNNQVRFGAGTAAVDFGQSTFHQDEDGYYVEGLEQPVYCVATAGGVTRVGTVEMFIPAGGSTPAWGLGFFDNSVTVELVQNGDAETGDTSHWTEAHSGTASWVASSDMPSSGSYCFAFSGAASNGGTATATFTSDRMAVNPSKPHSFRTDNRRTELTGDLTASYEVSLTVAIAWYDDPTAGSLIRTDTVLVRSAGTSAWAVSPKSVTSPSNAASCVIVATGLVHSHSTRVLVAGFALDNISLYETLVDFWLYIDDNGVHGLNEPTTQKQFFDQAYSSPAMTEAVATAQPHNCRWLTDVGADGDEYLFKMHLMAGTYTFDVTGAKAASCGKTDLYLDTTKINGATPFDWYAAGATWDIHQTVTGVNVAVSGLYEVKIKINGKNALGGYKLAGTCITATKTA